MKKRLAKHVLVAAVSLFALAGALLLPFVEPYSPKSNLVRVPENATAREIGLRLHSKGMVRSARLFAAAARVSGNERNLRAGLYEIPAGSSPRAILRLLRRGRTAVLRVTIPEGLAAREIASILEEAQLCTADDFLAMVEKENLEGYLFPDTYLVPSDFSAAGIARLLVRNYERKWLPEWDRQKQRLGMSRHEITTLASIIEREAGLRTEKPLVSSVFHNRLRRGMPLQACPTVLYALGSWNIRLSRSLLLTPSPYNTYLHRGLPPGPICNPGAPALSAALFPAESSYLFFVSNRDGTHTFSRTLREHNLAAAAAREAGAAAEAAAEENSHAGEQ